MFPFPAAGSAHSRARGSFISENGEGNNAYKIAEQIYNTIPVIYGEVGGTAIIGVRWRAQLAENSKMLASFHALPELDHNEIVGWKNNTKLLNKMSVIWLLDQAMYARNKTRQEITKDVIGWMPARQIDVSFHGATLIERLFHLIHVGDWVSYWCAILHETDPTPVDSITFLKSELAKA